MSILQLEEAQMASIDELRADIIRSAARGQGPTFIAAKLDMLIAKARAQSPSLQQIQRRDGVGAAEAMRRQVWNARGAADREAVSQESERIAIKELDQ